MGDNSEGIQRGGETGKNEIANFIIISEQPRRYATSISLNVLVRCRCPATNETELAQHGNNDSSYWDSSSRLAVWAGVEAPS